MTSLICGMEKDTNELTEHKEIHRLREGTVREFGMDMYTLLYLKCIAKPGSTVQHRELCSRICGSLDGRGAGVRVDTRMLVAEPLLFT